MEKDKSIFKKIAVKRSKSKIDFSLFIFAFILFSFFSFNIVSAETAVDALTLAQSKAVSESFGTAGIVFDNTGSNLYAFDSGLFGEYNKQDTLSVYSLGTPYDLSTLIYSGTSINNVTFGIPPTSSIVGGYITRNGNHLYLALANKTGYASPSNYTVMHYTMNNWDLGTLAYSENFTIAWTLYADAVPFVHGIYVSDDGSYMVLSGKERRVDLGGVNPPTLKIYLMSNAYNVSTMAFSKSIFPSSYSSTAKTYTPWISADGKTAIFSQQEGGDRVSAWQNLSNSDATFPLGSSVYDYGEARGNILYNLQSGGSSVDVQGIFVANDFGNVYLFGEKAGTIYKYNVNNFNFSSTTTTTTNSTITSDVIDNFLGVFPNSETLTLKQKLGWVFFTILIVSIILLLVGSSTQHGVNPLMLYLIAFIDVGLFVFFIGIGYISTGILIILILAGLVFAYFKFKGSGGNNG